MGKSRGGNLLSGPAFPEILKASAEFGAAEGDDGVGAGSGPVHAGPLEPGSNHYFASGFQDAGGSAQTPCVKLRVSHTAAIAKDIRRAFGRLVGGTDMG